MTLGPRRSIRFGYSQFHIIVFNNHLPTTTIIMAPRLKVLLPSSGTSYPPTRTFPVNSPTPTPLKTADFEGEISVWVKDYHGEEMKGDGHEYFDEEGRNNNTYSIVVRGKPEE